MPAMMGSAETRNCVSKAVCELSSSQESSFTQSVKEILRRRIEWKRVQQHEERFSRSQDNATLSNWPSILSNLGYFCEVRSKIATCGKIHGAYCRLDYLIDKSQVHLHLNFLRKCCFPRYFQNIHTTSVSSSLLLLS